MPSNRQLLAVFLALLGTDSCNGFSSTLFQPQLSQQVTAPTIQPGVDIELPDFDELFVRVRGTSPLARVAMQGGQLNGQRGLSALETTVVDDDLPWKTVESNKNRLVHQIQKIDNFQGLNAPLLRFRCRMKGPCLAHVFASFLTTKEYRSMWDESLANVYEKYPIEDLDCVNMAMEFGKYGQCSKVGVGYCTTKPSFGVDSREQLTMCGIQDFHDGSSIIWGTEMEDHHNHLLPEDEARRTRAKSHLFATTMIPTGHDTFDVEYVIQLEIGGKIPNWLTTPIVIENVKNMFRVVDGYFKEGEGGALDEYLKDSYLEALGDKYSLLLTP
ncbi:expressed unknown protein [Seminavis robusta]|uniref:START domain-containing protein n=1 Tax=Seminavis robusta TaxID=568900 RepID=A0A9N8DLS0_9STRA|nr:expressed unknown protein [Seminavis robusta]|eukprot:Sro215_g088940.1 n/a (328) ;mRNA; f:20930-22000